MVLRAWSGLEAADAALVRGRFKDSDPGVRAAAIRVSESLYKAGDQSFYGDVVALGRDGDASVALQALCTARLLNPEKAKPLVQASVAGATGHVGMREIAMQMLAPRRSWGREFSGEQKALLTQGNEVFNELCFTCHNPDGRGTPIEGRPGETLAPALAGSRTVTGSAEGLVAVLLKGLAGPVNGKAYDAQMVPMESNNDQWIAAVASYIRNSFGNKASTVTAKQVADLRDKLRERTMPFTTPELVQFGPPMVGNRAAWKLTASHNPDSLRNAVDGNPETRFDTRKPQVPGMWLQVELPDLTPITGLVLDAGKSGGDFPRGYTVEVSGDGVNWGVPVAKGEGRGALTEIGFKPARARFVRVTQTGESKGSFWSVHELEILAVPPPVQTVSK